MPVYFPTTSNALYGPGPVSFRPAEVEERLKRSELPGVDYHITLKMGRRRGHYTQSGWIVAGSVASAHAIQASAENCVGSTGVLKDHYGTVHSGMTLVGFYPDVTVGRRADACFIRYSAVYDQSGQ